MLKSKIILNDLPEEPATTTHPYFFSRLHHVSTEIANDNQDRQSYTRITLSGMPFSSPEEVTARIKEIENEVLHGTEKILPPQKLIPMRIISIGDVSEQPLAPLAIHPIETPLTPPTINRIETPLPHPNIHQAETPSEVAQQIAYSMRLERADATSRWQELSLPERVKRTFTGQGLRSRMSLKELQREMQKIQAATPDELSPRAPRTFQKNRTDLPEKSFLNKIKSSLNKLGKSIISAKNALLAIGSDPAQPRSKVKKGIGIATIGAATVLSGFVLVESCNKGDGHNSGGGGPTSTQPTTSFLDGGDDDKKQVAPAPTIESQVPIETPPVETNKTIPSPLTKKSASVPKSHHTMKSAPKAKISVISKDPLQSKPEIKKEQTGEICQDNTRLVTGNECVMPQADASKLRADLQSQLNQLNKSIRQIFSPIDAPYYNVYTPHFKGKYQFSQTTFNDDNVGGVVKTKFTVDSSDEANIRSAALELQVALDSAKTPLDFSKAVTKSQNLQTLIDKKITARSFTISTEVRQANAFNLQSAEEKIANIQARYPDRKTITAPSNVGTTKPPLDLTQARQSVAAQKTKPRAADDQTNLVQDYHELEDLHHNLDEVIAEYHIKATRTTRLATR